MSALAPTLQAFFTDRLARQQNASPHTVASYRDTFRLLLGFAAAAAPARRRLELQIEDLDAALIGAFLDHLEHERGNSVRTRNARLAAIHSLFRYAALRHPEHAALIERVLAIPPKRCDRAVVSFLTGEEIDALLAAPDTSRWIGRRDHALLLVAVQTGLRVSELTGLRCARRPARRRRPRALPRQGTQAALHPAHRPDRRRAARLADRAPRPTRAIRCSPPAAAARSAATPSRCSSPNTRSPRGSAAPRSTPRRSRRTSCATPPP